MHFETVWCSAASSDLTVDRPVEKAHASVGYEWPCMLQALLLLLGKVRLTGSCLIELFSTLNSSTWTQLHSDWGILVRRLYLKHANKDILAQWYRKSIFVQYSMVLHQIHRGLSQTNVVARCSSIYYHSASCRYFSETVNNNLLITALPSIFQINFSINLTGDIFNKPCFFQPLKQQCAKENYKKLKKNEAQSQRQTGRMRTVPPYVECNWNAECCHHITLCSIKAKHVWETQ